MKLKALALFVAVASGVISTQSSAVYNLYKKDGLSLDINGEVNVHFKNDREQFTYQYDQPGWTSITSDPRQLVTGTYEERTDRRTRLGQDDGASWMDIRGSQKLPQDWRVTGTIGFGYADSDTGLYLNSANLAFDKLNVGSISLGRQYLHTGYVTRTGTFTTLDTFSGASIRTDYTAIPNLHLSAYYSTPSSSDVRRNSNSDVEGWGASASYRYPLADNQSIRVAAGYSDSRANPQLVNNNNVPQRNGNQVPVDSKGYAGSVEYRHGNFLAAVDAGRGEDDLSGNVIDSAKTDFVGVKLGYQFTPRFSMTAGYGQQETKRKNQQGVTVVSGSVGATGIWQNVAAAYEPFLFPKTEETRAYIRGDYYLRDNVRLYGRIDSVELQHELDGKDFANLENTAYRAGVSFTF
ncbi:MULTISPECIES: porin [Moraxella]|uniref:porin n=1 Tax=Moraxella TaxID=475 RepID=UPI000C9F30A1|nr:MULTISPECIES: porin [Moraxella]MDH2274029.1 hypothetical protein [Moraxella porci]PNP96312.1 hypothetical protein AZ602_09565 [Moraxella sp. RCAD0137]